MKPCAICGATPTRRYLNGRYCEDCTPAKQAGRPESGNQQRKEERR